MNPRVSDEVRMAGILPSILKFISTLEGYYIAHDICSTAKEKEQVPSASFIPKVMPSGFLAPLLLWDAG